MPNGVHFIDIPVPIQDVWDFVSRLDKWAPLVPGYMIHEILNDRQSTWTFVGDLGIMKKEISMKVDITDWKEPTEVVFDLTGLNENFIGGGFFKAEALSANLTRMTGCLDITAKGLKGPVANGLLKSYIPQTAKELTEAVAEKIAADKKVKA
ncbi:SRPBCC family protein [Bacillus methanolicus]|uniref:CoxG family protein n=1 Tax=Bacillus methanolicus TaxID=1471 RepID=UPI00238077B0|nr:SRPBCC family protein [Bacillus methanolicus]MDE3838865.1 SRPBCC family protein [Bacillus methanolicus]